MTEHDYNYATFDMAREMPKFAAFPDHPLHVGTVAPDFPLEDLATAQPLRMKDLWRGGLAVIEFGSYT
ncbi:MAG: hypothetical protein KGL52_05915 [Rhodospirillales bacterium]|nr:hypothetical protein [Rhodospirillales bacterium]